MAYVPYDPNTPDPATQAGTAFGQSTRDNLAALRDAAVIGSMPGWSLTPSGGTAEQPQQLLYASGSERLKAVITWGSSGGADGSPTQIVLTYSSDGGTSWHAVGTAAMTYDSAGNLTNRNWS